MRAPDRISHVLGPILACAAAALLAACGNASQPTVDVTAPDAERCEILDPSHCLLPFPSDRFTVDDPTTDTGKRVSFPADSLPANASGVHIDPTEWNRNDGFSPGAQMTTLIPGLDAAASALPPVTDLARSLDPDSPVVVLDTDAGERILSWAELDAHADDPARRALLIHPAISLREGHHHIVALRRLADSSGTALAPNDVFRVYRDRLKTRDPNIEARRPAMERIFATLAQNGVARDDLYLAWDFTVASQRSLSERLLHIRDDAFAALGGASPAFEVTGSSDAGVARIVRGHFEVPRYLTEQGQPGTHFNDNGGASLPARNGTQTANFVCTVPTAATPDKPARLFLYSHGLLGTADQVVGTGVAGALVNVAFCATDAIGMAAEDVPNVVSVLGDLSRFRTQADRLQQGHLNFLFLGRLMRHAAGLGSHPLFQANGQSVLDGSDLFFLGASQGGVLGGGTTAIAQDWTRAVLAVGATNYSLLVPRSVDFDEFDPVLKAAYPDELDRAVIFPLIQMLWDRGESDAYLQHLTTNPYPGTPAHTVMYFEAFGDHQVANVGTEVAVRTIGAKLREPALAPGRATAVTPYYGIDPIPSLPYSGSALVVWDFGTPAPPDANLPNRAGDDPHGKAADVPEVLIMVSEYLKTGGALVDVCGGKPCQTLP